jgi:hypothetical protein
MSSIKISSRDKFKLKMLILILISLNTDFESLFGCEKHMTMSVCMTPTFAYPLSTQSCNKSIEKVRLVSCWRNFMTALI